jgi:hypothetical protein
VRSLEVQVAAGRSIRVDETSLTLVGETSLAPKGVGPRAGAHAIALSGGWFVGGSYYNSWTLQATYGWRFSSAFALRARGLVGFPVSTGMLEGLRAFEVVKPTATDALRFIAGADVEWAALSGQAGPIALALSISLGASVAGLGSAGDFEVAAVRPAATATERAHAVCLAAHVPRARRGRFEVRLRQPAGAPGSPGKRGNRRERAVRGPSGARNSARLSADDGPALNRAGRHVGEIGRRQCLDDLLELWVHVTTSSASTWPSERIET